MAEGKEPNREATTILVVDDDRAVCESLKFSLELEGFRVRAYGGGRDLLSDPDMPCDGCLVIDQVMPGMSGLEVVDALRGRGDLTPVVLMVSHSTPTVLKSAAMRGIAVVEKPFFGHSLLDAIRAAIVRHS